MLIKVVCAIIEKNGLILAALRRSGKSQGGMWEFPGGKVDPGESDREALEREIKEELGCDAEVGDFACSSIYEYDGGKRIELLAYRASISTADPLPLEHERLLWVDAANAENLTWAPADLPIVRKIILQRPPPDGTVRLFDQGMV